MEPTPPKDPLRLRLAAASLRLLRRIADFLPSRVFAAFGSFLGVIFYPFFPREKKVMESQLRFVASRKLYPETSDWNVPSTQQTIMRACFCHTGEAVAEVFLLQRLIEAGVVNHSQTGAEQVFHSHFQGGRGVLALSGHVGCFELLAASHAARGVPVAVVGRRPNYSGIGKLLADLRDGYGVETIWRDDPMGARKLISWLKGGKVLAVLLDQDTELESRFPNFFGLPAASPVAPVRLAIKLKIPMITTFIVRTGRLQHEVLTETLEYDPEDEDAELKVLQEFHHRLEKVIIRYPSQWLWWHRRWRREPNIDYKVNINDLRGTRSYLEWLGAKEAT